MANNTGGARGPARSSGEPKITGMTHQPSTATRALIRQHVHGGKSNAGSGLTKQQARKMVQDAQVVVPGLTAGQLRSQVNAATGLKYGQVESSIRNQPARISDWYGQYQQAIKDAQAQQQAGYAAADQNLGALQTGLNTASQQQWAGQQQAMASDAASRGATVDPGLADQAKNASLTRSDVTAGLRGLIAGQGTVAKTGLVNRGVTATQQKGEALSANHAALVALLADKGNFRQQYRDTAVSNAAKTNLDNAAAQATLGQTAATTAKTLAQTANLQTQTAYAQKYGHLLSSVDPNSPQAKLAEYRLKYAQQHGGRFPSSAAPKSAKSARTAAGKPGTPASGPGSLTRTKEQEYISQIHTIAGYFRNPPVVNGKPLTPAQIVAMLQTGKNPLKKVIDPRVVEVAHSYANNNERGLGQWAIDRAHNLGIHVGGNFAVLKNLKPKGRPGLGGLNGNTGSQG